MVRNLKDLLKFVLIIAVNLNRWQRLGFAAPLQYIGLGKQHMENVMYAAILLQEFQLVGL